MPSLFCKDSALESGLKIAVNAAGIAIALNNPALASSILPVALALQGKIDGGSDNTILNGLLQQGVAELVASASSNPIMKAEIAEALTLMNFDAVTGKIPTFSNDAIKGIIDSFMNGVKAVTQAKI